MAQFDKRLMQILIKESMIDEDKAAQVMEYANSQKRSFSAIAIEDGYVDDNALVGAVAKVVNMPPIDLSKIRFLHQYSQPQMLLRHGCSKHPAFIDSVRIP